MSEKAKSAASVAKANDPEAMERKKPRGPLIALLGVVACGGAGAASYLMSDSLFSADRRQQEGSNHNKSDAAAVPAEEKLAPKIKKATHEAADNGKKKSGGNANSEDTDAGRSHFHVIGERGVYSLRPLVISLKPQGQVRYLKLNIAVETTTDSEAAFVENELRIIDFLTTYLRTVKVSVLENPAEMARLKEQLSRRVAFIVDPAPVNAVLVTDFILS